LTKRIVKSYKIGRFFERIYAFIWVRPSGKDRVADRTAFVIYEIDQPAGALDA
jgi:hypothetical protein